MKIERGLVAGVLWLGAGVLLWRGDLGPLREPLAWAAGGLAVVAGLGWGSLRAWRSRTELLPLTLLLSLFLHAGLGVAMATWVVVRRIAEPLQDRPLEVVLDSEALAKEKLAVRIREEVAPLVPGPLPAPESLPLPEVLSAPVAAEGAFPPPEAEPLPLATPAAPPSRRELPALPRVPAADLTLEVPEVARAEEPVTPRVDLRTDVPPGPGRPVPLSVEVPLRPEPLLSARPPEDARAALPPLARPEAGRLGMDADVFALRNPRRRERVLERLGGDPETEAAVVRALDWLKQNQESDGRWSVSRSGGEAGHDVAGTGLALLCFYGWGGSHREEGPYRDAITSGLRWLLSRVGSEGDLTGGRENGMYDQGAGTLALAEAYGLTRDPDVAAPLGLAVDFIVRAQNDLGGWRYRPASRDADTSVTGWQVMALRSAELAGLEVPARTWEGVGRWLRRVGGGRHGGLYGYVNEVPHAAMVAQGMFTRQLLGSGTEEPRMRESEDYLFRALPEARRPNFYYWYCGSLALYQRQGEVWALWNARLKEILLSTQSKSGKAAGSWGPTGDWGRPSGRLGVTCLATLSLEVYYRYLPLTPK